MALKKRLAPADKYEVRVLRNDCAGRCSATRRGRVKTFSEVATVNGEEALEYLSAPDVMHIKHPGDDARCDEAVAMFCQEYRYAGPVPRFYTDEPARRACSVLLMYATQYMSKAALGGQNALLDKGLVAMDVAEAATLDPHEVGRIVDRFIMLVGTVNAEPRLLTTAARVGVSEELKALIRLRIAKIA